LDEPNELPYFNSGENKIPTIHIKDLVKFVIKISEAPPENNPYILAIDNS